MTIADLEVQPEFRVGRVFAASLQALVSNPVPLLVLPLLALSPAILIFAVQYASEAARDSTVFTVVAVLAVFCSLVFYVIARAAALYGTVRHLQGRTCELRDCLTNGRRNVWKLISAGFVAELAVGFGYSFFLIPGFFLDTLYWVVEAVAVVERNGVGASLRRSASLTKGNRWRVFGIILVCGVLEVVMEVVPSLLPQSNGYAMLLSAVVWMLSLSYLAFAPVVITVTYYHLRQFKDGVDIDEIAAVFD